MSDAFQSQRAEFTRNMGECLIKFGEIERVLYNIFSTALNSSNYKMSGFIYSSLIAFSARRAIINAAVSASFLTIAKNDREKLEADWKTLQGTMNDKLPKRNKVAHYFYYIWGWEDRVEPVLQQPMFSWENGEPSDKFAPVDNDKLVVLQKDLDSLQEDLSNFFQALASVKRIKMKPGLL